MKPRAVGCTSRTLAVLVFLLTVSSALRAQGADPSVWDAPWQVGLELYGWLPQAPADVTVKDNPVTGLPSHAGLPESLSNIVSAAQMLAMFRVKVDKGRLGVFTDAVYYKGKHRENFTGALGQLRTITVREELWLIDFGVSYELLRGRFGDRPGRAGEASLAPYVALRWLHDDLTMFTNTGVLGDALFLDTKINTKAPVIGGKASVWATNDIRLELSGDYGGFEVQDMHDTYQVRGVAEYRFEWKKRPAKVFGGYRFLHLDLENTDVGVHVDVKGPFFGFGLQF